MAEGIRGDCECGFQTDNLISGFLMSGDSYKLVACYECAIIESVLENKSLQKCGKCRHHISDVRYDGRGYYKCPSCLKPQLFLDTNLMVD